ncbi:MAG TPA: hypothetical protein LFV91_00145 [Rickettsia endosymbiont of Bembidion nr. Transversale]|nr:hypothetical protein [Rickettsia endosymbiont of Bembidion nr. Transversale]
MKKSKSPTELKFNFITLDKDKVLKFVPALPIILQDNAWSKLSNMKGSIEAGAEIIINILNFLSGNSSAVKKIPINTNKNMKFFVLKSLFNNYEYKNIQEHKALREVLRKYHPEQKSNGDITFLVNNAIYTEKFSKSVKTEVDNSIESIFSQLEIMKMALECSIENNHYEVAEKLFTDIFSNARTNLDSIFSQQEYVNHKKYTTILFDLVNKFMSVEYQIKTIIDLTSHLKHYFNITAESTDILINNKHSNEAEELLTAALYNITIDDKPKNQDIGWCYYKLGYLNHRNGQREYAVECYKNALDKLPATDKYIIQTINYNLWGIYSYYDADNNIEALLNQMPESSLKDLLKLGRNLTNITTSQLDNINRSDLQPEHTQMFDLYKYSAKYNALSIDQKSSKKTRFTKDLNTIIKKNSDIDKLLALSVAIYTEQFDIARNILNTVPENEIEKCKKLNLSLLRSYLDPDSIIYDADELKKEEKVEVLNAANTSLMAEDKSELVSKNVQKVLQNVEKVLEFHPQNEETLEIGINAALLNNDLEKAKEYANQLSKEKQEEIFIGDSEEAPEIDYLDRLLAQYDAKKIHQYYQDKKEQQLHILSQKITHYTTSWNIPGKGQIKSTEATYIGKYKGQDCYSIIDDKVKKSIGSLLPRFEKAMEKGIIHHQYGINGVKFIEEKAIEIKVRADKMKIL